jgi:predicted enzyme related to lactoylglutathione lyase
MARVVHFEIHADDPERAIDFYESALGWEFSKWEGPGEYWLVITGSQNEPGINGGLIRRQGPLNGDGVKAFVCTVQVESIDEIASKIEGSGGKVSIPKFSVPGVGWVGYFEDTEGNTFGAMEPQEQPETH